MWAFRYSISLYMPLHPRTLRGAGYAQRIDVRAFEFPVSMCGRRAYEFFTQSITIHEFPMFFARSVGTRMDAILAKNLGNSCSNSD